MRKKLAGVGIGILLVIILTYVLFTKLSIKPSSLITTAHVPFTPTPTEEGE